MSLEEAVFPHHRFLRSQPWFAALPADTQTRLLERTLTLSGRKGEVMLAAGSPVKGWYAVLSGLVKLQSTSCTGRVSAFLGVPDGEWFGEGSVLKTEPRRYDVIALRDTLLLCLPRAQFDELLAHSLPFNHFLVAHLNRRLGQAMTIIEAERLRSPEQRVALYLTRVFWQGRRRLVLSQEELGHLAGLSRQTVNRALKTLEQEGLVSLEFGRVAMLDEQALAAYASRPQAEKDKPAG
ncbi:Crp/Fnr family transcriptional regulator [Polaromonas sp. YR568]|uniref:Crp/Fnr family transcriptional regulator n=1 Tax=Polaromonas sp. YR568 TaxID=1855301 RepID=UPI003137C3EB